ncbi:MAG: hypothetical protein AAGM38_12485 [Pseudomonadota bacterium]
MLGRRGLRAAQIVGCALLGAFLAVGAAAAQDAPPPTLTEEERAAAEAEAKAVRDSLGAIDSILEAEASKTEERDRLRAALDRAENDVDSEELKEALEAVNADLAELNGQIEGLATGVSSDEVSDADAAFDINAEIEALVEPFLLMIKSATENARAIARLEQSLDDAESRREIAVRALTTLRPMLDAAPEESEALARLTALRETWTARREAAEDQAAAAERQLELRRSDTFDPGRSTGEAFSSFVQERGRNLLLGVLAFAGVFLTLRLVKRGALALLGPTRSRTVVARLFALLFDGVTVIASFGALLTVFNYFHDWLLTGMTILLLLALGWVVLRSLPSIFEQVTLLLNLGAVQEGERLMFDGAPWLVKRLDVYTDLVNPALRGGSFTIPARVLTGLHSRPMDEGEAWFPTEEGDWVLLGDEVFGEVIFQSPEMVQVREEGGAIATYTLAGFLEQNPTNLSHGFRASIRFGLDYRHQELALKTIPEAMKAHIGEKLPLIVDRAHIRATDAFLVAAGASALDFELEADLAGAAAPLYEDLCEALTRIAVEVSLTNGWVIPTPQLTVHRA